MVAEGTSPLGDCRLRSGLAAWAAPAGFQILRGVGPPGHYQSIPSKKSAEGRVHSTQIRWAGSMLILYPDSALARGDSGAEVFVYDAAKLRVRRKLLAGNAEAITSVERSAARTNGGRGIAFSRDSHWVAANVFDTTVVWAVGTGLETFRVSGQQKTTSDPSFSPDGMSLAVAGPGKVADLPGVPANARQATRRDPNHDPGQTT